MPVRYVLLNCLLLALAIVPTASASSCFVLAGEDALLFSANFDSRIWPGLLFVNPRGLDKKGWAAGDGAEAIGWRSRFGSVTVNSIGYQLPWAGMNEAGLVMSTVALNENPVPEADGQRPLAAPLWVQYLLDTCATVQEALDADTRVRLSGSANHYLLCDAEGDCAIIELLAGEMLVHRGAELPIRALTGMPYAECLALQNSGSLEELERTAAPASFDRMADLLAAYDPETPAPPIDYAFAILDDVSSRLTRWSLTFDILNHRMQFRTDTHRAIRSIDLGALDFTCSGPARLLDIHADRTGDITDGFEDFAYGPCLNHLLRAAKEYQLAISDQELREHFDTAARFPCAFVEPD